MTFQFLAGRSRLRSLHQTVQRNIIRQHRRNVRYESSKPNGSGSSSNGGGGGSSSASSRNASTVAGKSSTTTSGGTAPPGSGSYWAWTEPIKVPFRAYERMQQRSPLMTQLETTLIIYFLGDLSAQAVQTGGFQDGDGDGNSGGAYEPIRGLRALIIGGISSIPSYKWFLWLGRNFNYASHLQSLAVKILVSQLLFTPLFNTYFFGMQTLLAGGSLADAAQRVRDTVPVSWLNSWKLWPAVTAFSFTFIAPHNRSIFAGVIAIGWQTYLSWLNRAAEALQREKDGLGTPTITPAANTS